MDHALLASQLLRALRGKRTQRAFSKRLGHRSNVASRWESGHAFPTAAEALRAAVTLGVPVDVRLRAFFVDAGPWLDAATPWTHEKLAALLNDLRGDLALGELAARAGVSRFRASRWLSGASEPRLPHFLALVEALSLRLPEFVQVLVDPASIPAMAGQWQRHLSAREAAFARPWSHAVLRTLELHRYRARARHAPGVIADMLGISHEEEAACLALLARAGQVRQRRGRWELVESLAIDLRTEPARLRALRAFWLSVAQQRLAEKVPGTYSFNVFSLSERDLEAVRQLYREFFQKMQQLVASSAPDECVVLLNTQIIRLDERA